MVAHSTELKHRYRFHSLAQSHLFEQYGTLRVKLDTNGNYLSEQWYDYIDSFYYGHSVVCLNNKFNFVDRYFHLVSPNQWFDEVDDFDDNGYSEVKIGDTWYKIDMNGQLYDEETMQPINKQNTNTMSLNELKHIISESIKRQLTNL